jgi:5-methylcytosine-specific restriction endonuclease McrA
MIDAATRRLVRDRAGDKCEYCGLPQIRSPLAALQIEHILPRKHGGGDAPENLALACIDCNLCKGSNIAGIDPATGAMTELFHPRH